MTQNNDLSNTLNDCQCALCTDAPKLCDCELCQAVRDEMFSLIGLIPSIDAGDLQNDEVHL